MGKGERKLSALFLPEEFGAPRCPYCRSFVRNALYGNRSLPSPHTLRVILAAMKKQYSDRDAAAAKAYGEAILRQGGLRHIQ